MQILISNDIKVKDYNLALLDYCKNNLVVSNPEFFVAQSMGRYLGNIQEKLYLYEKRGNEIVLPFGTIKNIWNIIKEHDITTDFADLNSLSMNGDIKLYPYQEKALNVLTKSKHGILEAPCGSGKTQIGIALIKSLGQKALWLTHTGDLLNQSMNRAKEYFNGDFGTITDGKVNIGKDITFATVQTMVKLDLTKYAKEWNVIIVDECHRVAGTPTRVMQFYKVLSHLKARHKYGLSATLHRADSMIKTTYAMLGDIVHAITDEEVSLRVMKSQHVKIDTGVAPSEQYLDFDGTMNFNGLMSYLMEQEYRNNLIINKLLENKDQYNLVLSTRIEHLKTLQKLAASVGLQTHLVVGAIDKGKRLEIFDEMRDGDAHIILSTYSLAKEGLDIPNLNRLHLALPQKDKAIIKQSAGRIERRTENKTDAIIYDYVDERIGYCLGMYKKRRNILK